MCVRESKGVCEFFVRESERKEKKKIKLKDAVINLGRGDNGRKPVREDLLVWT